MEQHLEVFVKVVELKSFSRAAEELHMTQPSVSQHIQALEQLVGTRLLERSNKFIRLNKAGEIVYHHALEIISLHTRMQRLVDDISNTASGKLTIGASYTFGEYVLPRIITLLRHKYPLIVPSIKIGNTKEICELIGDRLLDVGIIEGQCTDDKIYSEAFAQDSMVIFCSPAHRLAQLKQITVELLQYETWIVRELGSGTREAAENMFQTLGFMPAQKLEFGSTQIIKESVEAGLGITLLSEWAARKELALGALCKLKVSGTPITRQFSLIKQSASFTTKAVDVFWELIKNSDLY